MNPNVEPPLSGLPPPPQPPHPHRLSTSCDRHPQEHFTGFCPSCLCERLAVLEPSSSAAASSRKPPVAATAALKAIFKPSGGGGTRPGFFPELRRTKSFSASKNEGFSGVFEPQRKSCDVRVRNTLWSLFHQEATANGRPSGVAEAEPRNSASYSSVVQDPVFEIKEEEDQSKSETDREDEDIEIIEEKPPPNVTALTANLIEEKVEEIVEEYEEELCQEEELKPMKDHIDLDSQTKKTSGRDFKEIAGSFWSAASVFSKKLQNWRQKQKLKKSRTGCGSARLPVEKPLGRQYRETQSEIADYGFGRRSCDTDPRFSLDAARMSFDDPRYSFDEPRASWDGYMPGRMFPRMPTMVSLVEDAPVPHVIRSDTQIPVEDDPTAMNSINQDETLPGGSAQTRDYYSDSRRRKSLDRSSSCRKAAAAVVAEMDEMKPISNTKVSPATADYFHGPKLVVPDRDLNSNSLRDDYSDTFEIGLRDNASAIGNVEQKELAKKSRRWCKAWNIWGFIHRRSVNKDEDEDRYSRCNGVERSYSESWPEFRGERNGDVRGGFNPKVLRSNSSVSWRNSSGFSAGSFSNARKSCDVESNGHSKKKTDEFVWERNKSSRYSATNFDNGLLRFYMAPNGSRRGGSGKTRANHAHSIARTLLRLY
ncbi:auxin transporter-like protein 2-like [Hibiscus syriacus]|uniref:Auxin transporter-like protein 2-like n=1 Tax=Hibiscus syriacus TaxID=106335 RepID=A0A6A2ZL09_HIBSY|nr:protein OCTOPUS-like [Hibiscus syriacus]KAE8692423.1 auxin transporter-like protein 2-like [Hibiscus syriacus]